jgi:hypothetical protein
MIRDSLFNVSLIYITGGLSICDNGPDGAYSVFAAEYFDSYVEM